MNKTTIMIGLHYPASAEQRPSSPVGLCAIPGARTHEASTAINGARVVCTLATRLGWPRARVPVLVHCSV